MQIASFCFSVDVDELEMQAQSESFMAAACIWGQLVLLMSRQR